MKTLVAFGAIVLALTGCAGSRCNTAEKIGDSWIGASIDDVSANPRWGYPTEETVSMGHKLVTWHYGFTDHDWGCNRTFGVDSNGKIQNARWSGACDTTYSRWARPGVVCKP